MLENLIRVLGPSGTIRGGENAAVSDDADYEKHGHDGAERDLHLENEWKWHFHLKSETQCGTSTGRQVLEN